MVSRNDTNHQVMIYPKASFTSITMLISADSLSKTYGSKDIIRSASLTIEKGESIGLVGNNGAGKTTLIRMLMGELRPDSGEVRLRTEKIGYLPQIPDFSKDTKVKDVIGAPYGQLSKVLRRVAELEAIMTDQSGKDIDWDIVSKEYSDRQHELGQLKGRYLSSFSTDALSELGLPDGIMERRMSELSGGEVTKVMLGRVLVQSRDTDVLFLDEPTSHLDVTTMEWMEDYLVDLNGSLVVVSHDRYFLDKVATRILEMSGGELRSYNGSYSDYISMKEIELFQRTKEAQKNLSERQRQERIIAEQKRRWGYLTTFKTRKKLLERTKVVEAPKKDDDIRFEIRTTKRSGVNVIMAKEMAAMRGDKVIIRVKDIDLETGDKLGIFGPNGSGKSTFLKAIMGEVRVKGDLWVAPGATIGYFAQSHDGLDPDLTAEEQLLRAVGPDNKAIARKTLASFLLINKDVERKISTLSGGERARVALANMIVQGRNLLVLDEPTNYLDIRSREAVEKALSSYEGTIVMVSHDRYLLDGICNKTGMVSDGVMRIMPGNYSIVKQQVDPVTLVDRIETYMVSSKFVDWGTRKKYKAGDRIEVHTRDLDRYRQLIERGFLKLVK